VVLVKNFKKNERQALASRRQGPHHCRHQWWQSRCNTRIFDFTL